MRTPLNDLEIEPLRRIGYALTQTSMQSYLDELSASARSATSSINGLTNATEANNNANILNAEFIGAKVNALTDAQKEELRYAMIMEQSSLAQQDMARTLMSPANQMRVFAQQVKMLARAVGNILIPVLNAIIPVAIAVANAIRSFLNMLGKLFGFEIMEVDYSGLTAGLGGVSAGADDVADSLGGVNDGLGKTAKNAGAAKKAIKDLLAPMDELHILNADNASGSGGSGGGSGGGGGAGGGGVKKTDSLFDSLKDYDMFKGLEENIANLEKKFKDIIPLVLAIGTLLAGWAIRGKVLSALKKMADIFAAMNVGKLIGAFKLLAAAILGIGGAVAALYGFYDALINGLGWKDFALMLGGTAAAAAAVAYIFKNPLYTGAVIAVGGILMLVSAFKELVSGNASLPVVASALVGMGGLVGGFALAFGRVAAEIAAVISALALLYASCKNLMEGNASLGTVTTGLFGMAIAGGVIGSRFGLVGTVIGAAIGLSLGAIAEFVAYMSSDALPAVDLFATETTNAFTGMPEPINEAVTEISETTKEKVGQFMEDMDALTLELNTVVWGGFAPTEEQIASVGAKADALASQLTQALEGQKSKSIDAINDVATYLGDSYTSILGDVEKHYADKEGAITQGEEQIRQIMQNAADQGRAITEEEGNTINEIVSNWKDVGVRALSESQLEADVILHNLKANTGQITAEMAADTLKHAKEVRDQQISDAEEHRREIQLEAQEMYNTGAITEQEYAKMMKAADDYYAESEKTANDTFASTQKAAEDAMGEQARYFDTSTGEMKSKWEVFGEDFKATFGAMGDSISEVFTEDIPSAFGSAKETVSGWVNDAGESIGGFVDDMNLSFDVDIPNAIEAAGGAISQWSDDVAYDMGYATGTVIKWGEDSYSYLSTNVPQFLSNVINWFSQLPSGIWNAIVSFITVTLPTWGKNVYDFFAKTVPQTVEDIKKWFGEMPSKIWDAIVTFITVTIPKWATDVYNGFKAKVENIIASVKGFFTTLPSKIWEAIVSFVTQTIPEWAGKAKEKFREKVEDIKEKVGEWFKGLPSKIREKLNQKWEEIKGIGGRLLDGIFEGFGKLGDKVKGWADKFTQGVKDALGIHSPSRVFKEEVGKWLGEGTIEGMLEATEANMSNVTDAYKEMGVNIVKNATEGSESVMGDFINTFEKASEEIQKVFDGIKYDPSIDYQALINEAVEAGDMAQAAVLERQRNAKIKGEGITEWETTDKYSSFLSEKDLEKVSVTLDDNSKAIAENTTKLTDMDTAIADYTEKLSTGLSDVSIDATGLSDAFDDIDFIDTSITDSYSTQFDDIISGTSMQTDTMSNSFKEVVDLLKDNATDFKKVLTEKFTIVEDSFKNVGKSLDGIAASMKEHVATIVSAIEAVEINVYNVIESSGEYATGGFPTAGQYFLANEAGAEMIGSVNGNTAVVNNDQIVAAVSQGVAQAVSTVMANQKQQPIDLYLDGEKIYSNQQKVARKKGVKFDMGSFSR